MARRKKNKDTVAEQIRDTADNLSENDPLSMSLSDEMDFIADSVSVNGIDRAIEETEMRQRWVTEDLRKDRDNRELLGRSAAYEQALTILKG